MSQLRRLTYRAVQRLNQRALQVRIERLKVQRAARLDAIRSSEDAYLRRFGREPLERIVSDIDADSGLNQIDRDLLANELIASLVFKRSERKQQREARGQRPSAFVGFALTPEYLESLTRPQLADLLDQYKFTHSALRGERLRDFDPAYQSQRERFGGVATDALEDPVRYYVDGLGAHKSNSELEGLTIQGLPQSQNDYVRNRIFLARRAKQVGLKWEFN